MVPGPRNPEKIWKILVLAPLGLVTLVSAKRSGDSGSRCGFSIAFLTFLCCSTELDRALADQAKDVSSFQPQCFLQQPQRGENNLFYTFSTFLGPGTMSKAFSRPWGSVSRQKCRIWMRICQVIALFVLFDGFGKLPTPFWWFGVPFLWFWDLGRVLCLHWNGFFVLS